VPSSTLGTPIFALYRAQYLLCQQCHDQRDYNNGNPLIKETTKSIYLASAYAGVSCFEYPYDPTRAPPKSQVRQASLEPNDIPEFLRLPRTSRTETSSSLFPNGKRTIFARPAPPAFTPALNSALVMSNVVSFHVRIMPIPPTGTAAEFINYNDGVN